MPWPTFEDLVAGLMQSPSRVARFFAPTPAPRTDQGERRG